MIGVVGRYDPHDGKAYLEIRPLQSLNRWFWDAAMCTLGRAAFEANLPGAVELQSAPPKPRPFPKAIAKKLAGKRQMLRVALALRQEFPPDGKAPKSLTGKQCAKRLSPYWEADRKRGLKDPDPETCRRTMKLLGRAAD
jgi:hypothetical protein